MDQTPLACLRPLLLEVVSDYSYTVLTIYTHHVSQYARHYSYFSFFVSVCELPFFLFFPPSTLHPLSIFLFLFYSRWNFVPKSFIIGFVWHVDTTYCYDLISFLLFSPFFVFIFIPLSFVLLLHISPSGLLIFHFIHLFET